jgi:hypothetical protein
VTAGLGQPGSAPDEVGVPRVGIRAGGFVDPGEPRHVGESLGAPTILIGVAG